MRKFLVKNFVLDYSFILFNRRWSAPRASRIIFPLMVITGYLVSINPNYPKPDLLLWLMYFLSFLSLFFGFVYFRFKPARFEELDEKQKLQYKAFKELYK